MTRLPLLLLLALLAGCAVGPHDMPREDLPSSRAGDAAAKRPLPGKPSVAKNKKRTPPVKNPIPADKRVVLNLYVSNQSFSLTPVDIRVFIDNELVIENTFPVKYQQNWQKFPLELARGLHSIHIESTAGRAEIDKKIDLQSTQWGVINFWYQPKDNDRILATNRKFTIELKGEPFYFDN